MGFLLEGVLAIHGFVQAAFAMPASDSLR